MRFAADILRSLATPCPPGEDSAAGGNPLRVPSPSTPRRRPHGAAPAHRPQPGAARSESSFVGEFSDLLRPRSPRGEPWPPHLLIRRTLANVDRVDVKQRSRRGNPLLRERRNETEVVELESSTAADQAGEPSAAESSSSDEAPSPTRAKDVQLPLLRHWRLSPRDIRFDDLIQRLRLGHSYLQQLSLRDFHLNDCGLLERLFRALVGRTQLHTLELVRCRIGDREADTVGDFLADPAGKYHSHVTRVSLRSNKFTHRGCESLCLSLAGAHNIVALDLHGNSLGDDAVDPLVRLLASQPRLHELDLSYCVLTDRGLESLSRALPEVRFLRTLRLDGNCLTAVGGVRLFAELKRNRSLTELSLRNTRAAARSRAADRAVRDILQRNKVLLGRYKTPGDDGDDLHECASLRSLSRLPRADSAGERGEPKSGAGAVTAPWISFGTFLGGNNPTLHTRAWRKNVHGMVTPQTGPQPILAPATPVD